MIPSTTSSFISYELTEEEQKIGSSFNAEQQAVIQNLLASYAEEYMTLAINIEDVTIDAANRRAYNKGAIAALKYLLENNSSVLTIVEGE